MYHPTRLLVKYLLIAASFLLMYVDSFSQNKNTTQRNKFDFEILRTAEGCRTGKQSGFFKFISKYNNPVCLSGPAALFISGLAQNKSILQKKSLFATESIGSTIAVVFALKFSIGRIRPFRYDSTFSCVVQAKGKAFPSGHTAEAFAMATAMSIAVPKWYVVIPAYAWASMIAYARVYLGVHYPTDVIGGAIVGTGCTYLMYRLNTWLQQTSTGHHPRNEILGTIAGIGTAFVIYKIDHWITKKRMKSRLNANP